MHIIHRTTCRVCGSTNLTPVIDLGEQYLQGSFLKDGYPKPPYRKIPTQVVRCDVTKNEDGCGLLQLAHTLPPEILYANYWYRSGTNSTMRNHLEQVATTARDLMDGEGVRALDIGCNDGTLLGFYPDNYERIGVDPSDIAREIPPPISVINSTFPSDIVDQALGNGTFNIVTSIAMFYDIEVPVEFAKAVRRLLTDDGIWIVEMSYLPLMLSQNAFDSICHEHLEYYSLAVLENIARRAGLRVFRADLNDINGGSIRLYLTPSGITRYDTEEASDFLRSLRVREFELELDTDLPYQSFQVRVEALREELSGMLKEIRNNDETVHIYGASTKGNVLLQWYGIGSDTVECAADRNPAKHGARTLGTDIPIVSEEESRDLNPDYYLVLPWHFRREFLERERDTIHRGTKMIFPLPDISVIGPDNFEEALAEADRQPTLGF